MKKNLLPGLLVALMLGAAGVWAVAFGKGNFPAFNRYYRLDEYLEEIENFLSQNIPFADSLSQLAVELQMVGGAKEFDGIFVGDDILVEDIGDPDENQTRQNVQTVLRFSEQSRIPTYFMLLPTKCAIKQNEIPQAATLFNQRQFIEQTYNRLLGKATVVDVYPALFARFEEELYYKTDPNLTSLGAYYVYEVLAQRLDITPRPQEDFDIQYITHSYYGRTYQQSAYQDISPDVIALYRYQKNNRTYSVTHNDGYNYTYDSLYPQQLLQLADQPQDQLDVILGGDTGDITIRSNLRNRSTLLIVGDESVLPVIPFLASHYSQIRFVDLKDLSDDQIEQLDCSEYQRLLIAYSVDTFIHDAIPEKLALLHTENVQSQTAADESPELIEQGESTGSEQTQQTQQTESAQ